MPDVLLSGLEISHTAKVGTAHVPNRFPKSNLPHLDTLSQACLTLPVLIAADPLMQASHCS